MKLSNFIRKLVRKEGRKKLRAKLLGFAVFVSITLNDTIVRAQLWKKPEENTATSFNGWLPTDMKNFTNVIFGQSRVYLMIAAVALVGNGIFQIIQGRNAYEVWAGISFAVAIACMVLSVFGKFIFGA
ncbi:MAG: hypothetical protein ACFBSE_13810 [Prochloraceae cyanobacterium]